MDAFSRALQENEHEDLLTPVLAGKLIDWRITESPRVAAAVAAGAATPDTAGTHQYFGEGGGARQRSASPMARTLEEQEEETEEQEEQNSSTHASLDATYVSAGGIYVTPDLTEFRTYYEKLKEQHKDPKSSPQKWLDLIITNEILEVWIDDTSTLPPKGWIMDGWAGDSPYETVSQYMLCLILMGATNELLEQGKITEKQMELLALGKAQMQRWQKDVHLRKIERASQRLIEAGFETIRSVSTSSPSGNSRPRGRSRGTRSRR